MSPSMTEELSPFEGVETLPELFGVCYRHGGAKNLRDVLDYFSQQGKPLHWQDLTDASADLREVGMVAAADVLAEYAERQPPFDYRLQCPYGEGSEQAVKWIKDRTAKYGDAFDASKIVYSSPDFKYSFASHKCPTGPTLNNIYRGDPCPRCGKVMTRPESIY
jgi:hypothetical protein